MTSSLKVSNGPTVANAQSTLEQPPSDNRVVKGQKPLVRVGLLERYGQLDFRVKGAFALQTLEGETIYSGVTTDLRWRCKVETSEPARYIYSILVDTCDTEAEAEIIAERLRRGNHPARVLPYGREVLIGGNVIHEGRRWRVIVGAFEKETEARPLFDLMTERLDEFQPHIMRHRVSDPEGKVEVYDAEYDRSGIVDNGFRIVPEDTTTTTTLYGVRAGVGFEWEHQEDRAYRGAIEIRIDDTGHLMAINELLLDDYLKGVIPSEMHHTYPLEALKAQAVAARSYTMAKLAYRPSSDPIDFPATVHFQVFSGVTREHEMTTRAVEETKGLVLKDGCSICETYFSSNSGGYTESKENWLPPGADYLLGCPVMDRKNARAFKLDLTKEADVATWIRSYPASYSNPRGTNIPILDRNARYFRWSVTYSRRDLEDILQRKLGFDIGTLYGIQPLNRGVSGRITELEILGSHRNHKIRGELSIRRVLSESTLNSSCFIIDTVMGDMGDPVEFTFLGAGFGHGVGMDQTAAGVMATKGIEFEDILHHFYKGATIEKIW